MLFPVKEISPGERPVVKKWVNRAETVSLFMSLDVIVDCGTTVWRCHWPSFPLSCFGQRHHRDKLTSLPEPVDASCILFLILQVSCSVCDVAQTHAHTHRKTRKHRRHKQTCVNTHEEGTVIQTQTGNTGVSVAEDACVQQYGRWCQ